MTAQTAAPAPTTVPPLRPLLDQLAAGQDLGAVRDLVREGTDSGEGGSIVAAGVSVVNILVAAAIWFPFFKRYDNQLYGEEQAKLAAELEAAEA